MKNNLILAGLLLAFFLALFISPFASRSPDGLERVAEDKGFMHKGEGKAVITSVIADYMFPGVKNEKLATALAGGVGTLIVFGIGYAIAILLKRRSQK